jgi:hypothetical protein
MRLNLRIKEDPRGGMPCYEDGFIGEIDYFIDRCVLDGEQPLSTLDDAADALRILMTAERSVSRPETMEKIHFK